MQGLFSEADLDQNMIEIERRQMEREKNAKRQKSLQSRKSHLSHMIRRYIYSMAIQ